MLDTIRPRFWKVTTAPAVAVLTTAQAKAHLRVDFAADDDVIAALVDAATKRAEQETGLALINQTVRAELHAAPSSGTAIELPVAPLSSVTSVTYRDSSNVEQTLASAAYQTSAPSEGRAYIVEAEGYSWPSTRVGVESLVVTFVAGFGAAATAVPQDIKQGILLLVGHWYSNREDAAPVELKPIPQAAAVLFAARRRAWFAR